MAGQLREYRNRIRAVKSTQKITKAFELIAASRPRLAALADEGVTTVEIKSGYGLDTPTELKQLRVARALGRLCSVDVRTTLLAAHALGYAGSWLTDLFGTTRPEAKRLRSGLHTVAAIPRTCIASRATTEEQFRTWQRAVVEASRGTTTAALPGLISERKLEPALRTDLRYLKFSPGAKWVLAQDDGSIFVFSREPLEFKFRIDASETGPAQFVPDSSALVFL